MPNKKPKGKELTKEEKKYNKELSKRRITVEHTFGKTKYYLKDLEIQETHIR